MRRFVFILFMFLIVAQAWAIAGQTFQFYSTDVRPTTDLQLDVGTTAKRFNNVYCSNVSTATMVTTGNVGIGSATPSQKLDVNGTSRTGQLIDTGLTASKVVFTDASKQLTSTGIGTSAQFIRGDGSLDSSIYQTANSQWTTSGINLYDTLSGNVGIGSVSPQAKLDVEGNVYSSGSVASTNFKTSSGTKVLYDNNIYGSMYGDDVSISVSIGTTNTEYAVGTGLTAGSSNGFTFSNSNLTASTAGRYLVNWSASVQAPNNNELMEVGIMVDSTPYGNTAGNAENINATKPVCLSGTGLINLSANDIVKLYIEDDTGTGTATITHANVSLLRVNQ